MTGTISFGGLVSGLNVNSIITALLSSDQQQIANVQARQTSLQNRAGALNDINTKMSALQGAVSQLMLQSTLLAKSATVTNPTGLAPVLGATASSSAVSGSFTVTVKQLATATAVGSASAIGQAVTASSPLASAGFALTPTTGTFSINGKTITIDANTVLSDGTDAAGADTIISKINNSGAGVTASLTTDAYGRPNLLQLSSSSAIQLGSGADTSNFLSAANLLAAQPVTSGGTTTLTSTAGLGATNVTAVLNSARLATTLSASQGSFNVNGVAISYDATKDSLSDVINRINASNAGVVASYDPIADKVNLRSQSTGGAAISLQDVTGNFLAATGLLGATQSYGQNALFSISSVNGGAQLSSATNTVTGLVPGVTLNLLSAAPGQPVTVTVGTDASAATTAMQNFVSAFNGVIDLINQDTAYNAQTGQSGLFFGSSDIESMTGDLYNQVFNPSGLTGSIQTASDIGLSTGPLGSQPGTTSDLQLDVNKFTSALQSNPNAVVQLLQGTSGTGGIMGALNTYLTNMTSASGMFYQDQQSYSSEIQDLGNQISQLQQNLQQKQDALTQQFTQMEMSLAQLQSQGSQMGMQLSALGGSSSSSGSSGTARIGG